MLTRKPAKQWKSTPFQPVEKNLRLIASQAAIKPKVTQCWLDKPNVPKWMRDQLIQIARDFIAQGGNATSIIAALRENGVPVSRAKFNLLITRVKAGLQ